MPIGWIITIGVLLLVAALLLPFWLINRTTERVVEAEESDKPDPPFDIPVLRDKPKTRKEENK